MYLDLLEETYQKIQNLSINLELEAFEVVKLVHEYRMYWKPEKVNTILFAESHVFTDLDSLNIKHKIPLNDYPENYTRFVYCLSYGESQVLDKPISNNKGTPQFWKLFNESVQGNFRVVNNFDKSDKLNQKIQLLQEMQRLGIWLMDCSIVGIYNRGEKPSLTDYKQILNTSLQNYCIPIIKELKPKKLIVIGKSVFDIVHSELKSFRGEVDWIHQPNAMIKAEKRKTLLSFGL